MPVTSRSAFFIPLALAYGFAYPLSVDLTVKESASISASQYPIAVVVPLPEGAYQETSVFHVVDDKGSEVPAQFSVVNRWWLKDKSLRNVLVQFLADVSAGGAAKYVFRDDGHGDAKGGPLSVARSGDIITVTTGPLKFTVNAKKCRLFEQVWLDADGNGQFADDETMLADIPDQGGVLTDQDGKTAYLMSNLTDAVATVEESGPIRAVIKVETPAKPPGNPYGYKFRIYAYRGRSDVQIDYTLKNDVLGPVGNILYFDDFSIKFKPGFSPTTVAYGGEASHSGAPGSGSSLYQDSSQYAVAGALTGSGHHASGWMAVDGAAKGITASVRHFWQQYPKGFEYGSDGAIYLRLWPKGGQDSSGIYWLGDMQYKTHTINLDFHAAGKGAAPDAFSRLANTRPLAVVPVSWYAKVRQPSDQLGFLPVTDPVTNPYWDQTYWSDTLGWRNWWSNGRKATFQTGQTPQNWRADQFMISGDPKWFYRSEAWARQSADIRPTHLYGYVHPMSDQWSGFVAGGYAWRNWRAVFPEYEAGTAWDGWYPYDDQHAWITDMEDTYYYTGDRLLLDNLDNLGEIWQATLAKYERVAAEQYFPDPRAFAWTVGVVRTQITLTGDSSAVDVMSKAVSTFHRGNQDPFLGRITGGFPQTFSMGMLGGHLATLYRELPDGALKSRVLGAMIGIGEYLLTYSWSDDGRGMGRSSTEKPTPYYGNEDAGDFVATLYTLTGDRYYLDKCRIISKLLPVWTAWNGGSPGKMMTSILTRNRQDTLPPPPITDLEAFKAPNRDDLVLLKWTTPPSAVRYDIRSSAKIIKERLQDSTDTVTQENWWHCLAYGMQHTGVKLDGKEWALLSGPGVAGHQFLVRSFDSQNDSANLSGFSNIVKAEKTFNPDSLPSGILPKTHPKSRKLRIRVGPRQSGSMQVQMDLAAGPSPAGKLSVGLFGANGKRVRGLITDFPASSLVSLNTQGVAPGLYLLQVSYAGANSQQPVVLGN